MIQQFRSHPQFNTLKQLIQSNPAALPQVLQLIGQQSPALLEAIHSNEAEFLAMMNEPISAAPTPAPAAPAAGPMGPPGNPAQMMQVLASMPPAQRAAFAQQIGLSPEQLGQVMQMMATLPPEQLQQMMQGMGAMGGMAGHPGAITLTQAEMESVNRLVALGFSQQAAAQAFLACDRNEALAANFLMDNGWADDYGDDAGGEFDGGEGGPDDDMYS